MGGALAGYVLFVGHEAVHMAGEQAGIQLELDVAAIATAWGTYVRPKARKQGAAIALREAMNERLAGLGFQRVVGEIRNGNTDGYRSAIASGYEPLSVTVKKDL